MANATLLCASLVGGCDTQVAQVISGTLASETGPVAGTRVRLYESFGTCEGTFVEANTNQQGAFRFSTVTTKGGIAEVTQSISLCTELSGRWTPLWSTITGGGSKAIVLECSPLSSQDDEFCDMKIQ
jgi:hypothetical protein